MVNTEKNHILAQEEEEEEEEEEEDFDPPEEPDIDEYRHITCENDDSKEDRFCR